MGKTVLVVDDSTTLRTSVEYTLSDAGYEVLKAEDGEQGLSVVQDLESRDVDLGMILTDINMPNMDGISFIKEVKKTSFKYVPILVLTTESQESKKLEGKEAGASGWLVKPFQSEQLVSVVAKFIG